MNFENVNTLCQVGNVSRIQMMGYVLRTEDNKIIVIDGGTSAETDHLIELIKKMAQCDHPTIDAWILTHAHYDHISPFMDIIENHPDEFDIKAVYYNFPSIQYIQKYEKQNAFTIERFYRLLPKFADKAVIVTQDDVYEIGKARFEFLFTFEPDFTHNPVNNSSSVFKLYLGSKTLLFLGDLGAEGGRKLLANHKDDINCDYCQMAHHGQAGVEKSVYEAIKPEVCLWNSPEWLYNNDEGKGFNTHCWHTVTTRTWMDEIGGVKENIVEKDGDVFMEIK